MEQRKLGREYAVQNGLEERPKIRFEELKEESHLNLIKQIHFGCLSCPDFKISLSAKIPRRSGSGEETDENNTSSGQRLHW